MKDVRLFIGCPSHHGQICTYTHRSLRDLALLCQKRGIPCEEEMPHGESLVQRARNRLVHAFMKTDSTHLLFVDSDVGFLPEWVLKMLEADHPICAGIYPVKKLYPEPLGAAAQRGVPKEWLFSYGTRLAFHPLQQDAVEVNLKTQTAEVKHAATGFMLIKREVIIEMMQKYPETMYVDMHEDFQPLHALFECGILEGTYLSEDYWFCKRWRDLGGHIYAYLPGMCVHFGSFLYQGNLATVFPTIERRAVANDTELQAEAS